MHGFWTNCSGKKIAKFARHTAQKVKFSIKDFFSKCDQVCRKLRIWSHLLKKFLMENFIFLCSENSRVFCFSKTKRIKDSNVTIFYKFCKILQANSFKRYLRETHGLCMQLHVTQKIRKRNTQKTNF